MTASKKPSGKKATYRLVARREQLFEFEIVAMSPEGACKKLHERLKRDAGAKPRPAPDDAIPGAYSWAPPEECSYVLSGGDVPVDPTGNSFMTWNGKKFVREKIEG